MSAGITESGAGITESGEGSSALLACRCLGAGRMSDSAEELRARDIDLESNEAVDGRLGEFALISCSGSDA